MKNLSINKQITQGLLSGIAFYYFLFNSYNFEFIACYIALACYIAFAFSSLLFFTGVRLGHWYYLLIFTIIFLLILIAIIHPNLFTEWMPYVLSKLFSSIRLISLEVGQILFSMLKKSLVARWTSTHSISSNNTDSNGIDHLKEFIASLKRDPVQVFTDITNLHLIADSLPHAGIYAILNIVTGDAYIGSSKQGRMYRRLRKHMSGNGSSRVNDGIIKYGATKFVFVLVHIVDPIVTFEDQGALFALETSYISRTNSTYNILAVAGFKGLKQGGLFKNGISDAHRENIRKAASNRGPVSEETKKAISLGSKHSRWHIISRVDGSSFVGPNGIICTSARILTTQSVADFCKVSLRTITRATASTGIFRVKRINSPNSSISQRTWRIVVEPVNV